MFTLGTVTIGIGVRVNVQSRLLLVCHVPHTTLGPAPTLYLSLSHSLSRSSHKNSRHEPYLAGPLDACM